MWICVILTAIHKGGFNVNMKIALFDGDCVIMLSTDKWKYA